MLLGVLGRIVWTATIIGLALGGVERGLVVLALFTMIGITIVIFVWQVVGIWRSAGKHVGRGGKQV